MSQTFKSEPPSIFNKNPSQTNARMLKIWNDKSVARGGWNWLLVDANCGHDEADIYCNWKKVFISNSHHNKRSFLFEMGFLFARQCVGGSIYKMFILEIKTFSQLRENLRTFAVLWNDSINFPIFTQNRNNVQFGFLLQLFVKMNLHQSLWKCNPMTNTLALSLCYFVCRTGHKKCKNVAMTLKQ